MNKANLSLILVLGCAATLCAQDPSGAGAAAPGGRGGRGGGGRGAAPAAGAAGGVDVTNSRSFDQQSVQRGTTTFGMLCGSCHGADARGGTGKTDVDLVRSVLVLDDLAGKQIGEFLKTGRPDKGMPKIDVTPEQVTDIANFLHHNVSVASERGAYKYLDVLVGDPKAGETYFNGAGGCTSCHSVTGDLKGIGSKYDPPTLQLNIVTGGGGGRGGRGGRGGAAGGAAAGPPSPTAKKVTVTQASGKAVTGTLVSINDFLVTLRDSTGAQQSFFRDGDTPKVVVTDPLQAHLDLMRKYTDANMHDLTAYLATLK